MLEAVLYLLKKEFYHSKNCEKPIKDMRYIPLSSESYQLHNHIIFNKMNCAMFQKKVPKDFMCMEVVKMNTVVHIKSKQI